jgi:acetyl esterase/lipase
MSKVADNSNIDPRIRKAMDFALPPPRDFASREELLAEMAQPEIRAQYDALFAQLDAWDTEEVAPSAGLRIHSEQVMSQPDGNRINIQFIRPATDEVLPCVYYIHGGAMEVASCYNGGYRAWGRIMAAKGVAVAMVDFRNSLLPSSVPEVAPFPAGLNDCVSGLKWVHANGAKLKIDPARTIVAGDSGGGNLTLATGLKLKRDGDIHLIKGLYALGPFIGGQWPLADCPSSVEHNGIVADLHSNRSAMAYGIEAYRTRNPLAWPYFATGQDVTGLPPVVIQVYEFDLLRDEGLKFYRLLLKSGVKARCHQIMGATHNIEVISLGTCPELTHDTARRIAEFSRSPA